MRKRTSIIYIILFMTILLLINNIEEVFTSKDKPDFEVHFIDVGQGDAILVKNKAESILIDSGTRAYQDRLLNYLKNEKVNNLKYIIASHPHEDHIGGLAYIINNIKTEHIIMPNITTDTYSFDYLLDSITNQGVRPIIAEAGDTYQIKDSKLIILAPNSSRYDNLNNYSVGIKLVYGSTSFIFTGDAEDISEEEMVENYVNILNANVLKLGHHGSSTSSTENFIDAVNPQYAIISVGANNEYGHPHKKVLDMLNKRNILVYRTDLLGNILVKSDGENLEFLRR